MAKREIPQWVWDLLFIVFVVALMMTAIILSSAPE